jgi:hypothetical protein
MRLLRDFPRASEAIAKKSNLLSGGFQESTDDILSRERRPWLFVLQKWVDKSKLNISLLTYYVIDVI